MKKLISFFTVLATLAAVHAGTVDFMSSPGPVKPVHSVGQPPLDGDMFGEWAMMRYLKEANIPYSRLHDVGGWLGGGGLFVDVPNLFPDFAADETDPANYRFAYTDSLLAAMMKNGVEPFFRLGVTIENWCDYKTYEHSGDYVPIAVNPPADYAKWARICEHIVKHYNEGWANGFRYGITYWEIWNEPDCIKRGLNNMWTGTWAEYIELYHVASTHLKGVFGDSIKVGGYALTSIGNSGCKSAAEQFLAAVRAGGWPLDFFSYHTYDVVSTALSSVTAVDGLLNGYGFTRDKTERILNEWLPQPNVSKLGTASQAAEVAAEIIGFQDGELDLACIYDARSRGGAYGALFNADTLQPYPAYYSLKAFGELYALGKAATCTGFPSGVSVAAATDGAGGNRAILVVNLSNGSFSTANLDWGEGAQFVKAINATANYAEQDTMPATLAKNTVWLFRLYDENGEDPALKPIVAMVNGVTDPANGTAYSCTLSVTDPKRCYAVTWYDENGAEAGVTAPSYTEEGVYTNVVKVTADGYLDFYGTGVVTVTHYEPLSALAPTIYLTFPAVGSSEASAKGNGVVTGAAYPATDACTMTIRVKNPVAETLLDGNRNGVLMFTGALGEDPGFCLYYRLGGESGNPTFEQVRAQVRQDASHVFLAWTELPAASTLRDGKWHQVTATYDKNAQAFAIYIDGVSQSVTYNSADTFAWVQNPNTRPLSIGRHNDSKKYYSYNSYGSVADAAYYDVALSAEEVAARYAWRLTGDETGLVGWWPMDEGEGMTVRDAKGTNNGTIRTNADAATDQYWDGSTIAATVTGATGLADGTAYSCTLDVIRPATGWTAMWWDGSAYTLDAAPTHAAAGTYADSVRVTKTGYGDFYGTGVVKVVRYTPPPSGAVTVDPQKDAIVVGVGADVAADVSPVYLAWDTSNRGEKLADWAHSAKLGDVASAGGAFAADCAGLGIPSGSVIRAFVVKDSISLYASISQAKADQGLVDLGYVPGRTKGTSGFDLDMKFVNMISGASSAHIFGTIECSEEAKAESGCAGDNVSINFGGGANDYTQFNPWPHAYQHRVYPTAIYSIPTTANQIGTRGTLRLRTGEVVKWVVNGSAAASGTVAWPSELTYDYKEDSTMAIFGRKANGGESKYFVGGDMTLYGLRIYEKQSSAHVCVRDYVPAKCNGQSGLYETKTGAFHPASAEVFTFDGGVTNTVFTGVTASPAAHYPRRGLLLYVR